jgi:hypothetical protein
MVGKGVIGVRVSVGKGVGGKVGDATKVGVALGMGVGIPPPPLQIRLVMVAGRK